MCGGQSPTTNIVRITRGDSLHWILATASCRAWLTDSGMSPPPAALNSWRSEYTWSRLFVSGKSRVTYSSPRSRYGTRPIRTSPPARWMIPPAMDQIFCFAPSMSPLMDPVVSSTNTTSASIGSAAAGPPEAASASAAATALVMFVFMVRFPFRCLTRAPCPRRWRLNHFSPWRLSNSGKRSVKKLQSRRARFARIT